MTELEKITEIVEALNDYAFREVIPEVASFQGNESYLSIHWGDWVLWDSEGHYRDDLDFADDDDDEKWYEPSLELCVRLIHQYARLQFQSAEKIFQHFMGDKTAAQKTGG